MDSRRFLFVVGPPRTGTSLLTKILNTHPEIDLCNETNYFEEIYPKKNYHFSLFKEPESNVNKLLQVHKRYAGPPLANIRPHELFDPVAFVDDILSFRGEPNRKNFYQIYLKNMVGSKSRYIGEKTPRHLFHVSTLKRWFPDCKILITCRDGRGFLSSYKNAWKNVQNSDERKRLKALYHPVLTSLYWRIQYNHVMKYRDLSNVFIVNYESLASSPEPTVEKLTKFLDLENLFKIKDISISNTSYSEDRMTEGVTSTSIKKWRGKLTREEILVFELINGSFFQDTNFIKVFDDLGSKVRNINLRLAIIFLTFPYHSLKAILANRSRIGSFRKFLTKRFS